MEDLFDTTNFSTGTEITTALVVLGSGANRNNQGFFFWDSAAVLIGNTANTTDGVVAEPKRGLHSPRDSATDNTLAGFTLNNTCIGNAVLDQNHATGTNFDPSGSADRVPVRDSLSATTATTTRSTEIGTAGAGAWTGFTADGSSGGNSFTGNTAPRHRLGILGTEHLPQSTRAPRRYYPVVPGGLC